MLYNPKNRNSLGFAVGLCALAISAGLELSTARAQDAFEVATGSAVASASEVTTLKPVDVHPGAKPSPAAGNPAKPYFIEFRARSAYNYGHTFLVHGRVGQKITARDVVGLHPATESPVPWMIGHFIPVISETGASDGDYEDVYVIARYRVLLSEAEYRTILAQMRKMQRSSPIWHAVLYNCNAFVGDVAKFMGLKAPFNTMQMPKEFINDLKAMNGGRPVLSGEAPREPATNSERAQAAPSSPRTASGNTRAPIARPQTARPQQAAVRAPEQAAPSYANVQ